MFMIAKGRVHIIQSDRLVAIRYMGEFVGELSLLVMKPATATCMAADWCELMLLRRLDFQQLIQNYPDLQSRLIYHATHKDKMSASLNVRAKHRMLQASVPSHVPLHTVTHTSITLPNGATALYCSIPRAAGEQAAEEEGRPRRGGGSANQQAGDHQVSLPPGRSQAPHVRQHGELRQHGQLGSPSLQFQVHGLHGGVTVHYHMSSHVCSAGSRLCIRGVDGKPLSGAAHG